MIRNLLLTGGPTHHFDATTPILVELFERCGVRSTVVEEPSEMVDLLRDRGGALPEFDSLTVNAMRWRMEQPRYASQRDQWAVTLGEDGADAIDSFVRTGGGLLALHTAVLCFDDAPVWRELCGARWRWGTSSHPPLGDVSITVTPAGRRHRLTRGIEDFTIEDEVYGFLDEVDGLEPLLTGRHGGRDHPVLWARGVGGGRVVTDLLGHDAPSFRHPEHVEVLARSIRWLTDQPVDAPGGVTDG